MGRALMQNIGERIADQLAQIRFNMIKEPRMAEFEGSEVESGPSKTTRDSRERDCRVKNIPQLSREPSEGRGRFVMEKHICQILPKFTKTKQNRPCYFLRAFNRVIQTLKIPISRNYDVFLACVEIDDNPGWMEGWPNTTTLEQLQSLFLTVFWNETIQCKMYAESQGLNFVHVPLADLKTTIESWVTILADIKAMTLNKELMPSMFLKKLPYKLQSQFTPDSRESMDAFFVQLNKIVKSKLQGSLLQNMQLIPSSEKRDYKRELHLSTPLQ